MCENICYISMYKNINVIRLEKCPAFLDHFWSIDRKPYQMQHIHSCDYVLVRNCPDF